MQRYQAADSVIKALMDSLYKVNPEVEFSLRVFGHQHSVPENNCFDTRNEVMFSKDNRTQMALRLADIKPYGVTPIAYSLEQAAKNDLVDEQHNAYSIILITDGGESCSGNICDVVKTLISHKVYFKPYIVSLVDYAPLKTEYECLGDYLQVTGVKDIKPAVGKIVDAFRPMLTMTKEEYKQVQSVLANPPSALKVSIPPVVVPEPEKKPEPKPEPKPQPVVEKKPEPKPEPVVIKKPEPKPEPIVLPHTEMDKLHSRRLAIGTSIEDVPELKTVAVPNIPHRDVEVPLQKDEMSAIKTAETKTVNESTVSPVAVKPVTVPNIQHREVELPPLPKDEMTRVEMKNGLNTGEVKIAQTTLNKVVVPNVPHRELELPPLQKDEMSRLVASRYEEIPLPVSASSLKQVKIPKVPQHEPEPIVKETIERVNYNGINTVTYSWTPKEIKTVKVPKVPQRELEMDPLKKDTLVALKLMKPAHMPTLFVQDEGLKKARIPAVPERKVDVQPEPVIAAAQPKPLPVQPKPVAQPKKPAAGEPTGKEVKPIIKTEDAAETSLEIYFTNGKGKYYSSTPEVVLTNTETGQVAKKFHRTIDANNNPDPVKKLAPGTYSITVSGKSNLIAKNVVLENNKKTRVDIVVTNGSLKFEYEGNPTRPVKEFLAVVNEPFSEGGKVAHQKCTEELEYEPGNYHIKVNTEPVSQFNADLDFGSETVISIPEPGYIQFTNAAPMGKVYLYCVLGDEFIRWKSMDIVGNPAAQKLMLKPGKYQAHYIQNGGAPNAKETVETFFVKSNITTELELK